jgi:hypothetical protein
LGAEALSLWRGIGSWIFLCRSSSPISPKLVWQNCWSFYVLRPFTGITVALFFDIHDWNETMMPNKIAAANSHCPFRFDRDMKIRLSLFHCWPSRRWLWLSSGR